MGGCELVYHVAGVNSHCPEDPRRLWQVNVAGAREVVLAAAGAGIGRVVMTSSAAVIGEAPGTVGTEDSPHRGWFLSLYERSKLVGEQAATRAAAERDVELVTVHPTSVHGPPRVRGNGAILIAYANRRLRAFVDTHISIVDVRDVVDAHLSAAERGRPGRRYLLSAPAITSSEALEMLVAASGVRYPVWFMPRGLARGVATVVDLGLRARRRRSPVCRARVETLLHGHRYDGTRAARELGVSYTPPAEIFRRTIAWATDQGLIAGG